MSESGTKDVGHRVSSARIQGLYMRNYVVYPRSKVHVIDNLYLTANAYHY